MFIIPDKIKLKYLEKRRYLENIYNSPISYLNWDEKSGIPASTRIMASKLDSLEKKYKDLLEQEENELLDWKD